MGIDFSSLNRSLSTFSDGNAKEGPKYTITSTYHIGLIIGGSKNSGKNSLFRYIQAEGNVIPPKKPLVIVSTRVIWTNPFTNERSLVDLSKIDFDILRRNEQKDSEDLEETYGENQEKERKNALNRDKEEVEKLLKQCTCFIFVADPRKEDLFTDFGNQIHNLGLNTTIIVVCNFADQKSNWLFSLADIRKRCEEITSREPKGFDFWCLESCLCRKYGIKELMMVITIPFYQIKLHCLQEMMRETVENMEIGRSSIAHLVENASYEEYLEKIAKKKDSKQLTDHVRIFKRRDFETPHSFYLHDNTNNPHKIIHSRPNRFQFASKYLELESGSDCDDISPLVDGWIEQQKKAVNLDPSILTESLADFFEDVMNDDSTAERVSQSVDSIEMPTGASKDGADEASHQLAEIRKSLTTEPYPVPANATVTKEEEKISISGDEMIDSNSFLDQTLRFSETAPASNPQSLEEEMGLSK